ncbi:reverse transcriptase domain-containing protein [Tanacetum coccineum]
MGIAEDVIVKVEKFNFLADFIIVDFEVDPRVPIILGRPFLCTTKALMDLYEEKLTLRTGKEEVVTTLSSDSLPGSSFPSSLLVETGDSSLEEFAEELFLLDPFPSGYEDDNFDPEADLRKIKYLLNRDSSTDSSPTTDIDIIDLILDRFTDEPALGKNKDSKEKYLIDESNDLLPQLLDCDSTLHEELPEIDILPSFPSENKDKVFNPGILVYGSTYFVTNEVTQDKNLKDKTSSEELLILEDSNFLPLSSDCELLFHLELSVTETLLSFSSENKDKVFNPGILISKGVYSFTLG